MNARKVDSAGRLGAAVVFAAFGAGVFGCLGGQ
jgi:hypothetical protein